MPRALLRVAAGLLAFADTPLFPLGPNLATQVSSFTAALFFVFRVLALVLPQIPDGERGLWWSRGDLNP